MWDQPTPARRTTSSGSGSGPEAVDQMKLIMYPLRLELSPNYPNHHCQASPAVQGPQMTPICSVPAVAFVIVDVVVVVVVVCLCRCCCFTVVLWADKPASCARIRSTLECTGRSYQPFHASWNKYLVTRCNQVFPTASYHGWPWSENECYALGQPITSGRCSPISRYSNKS